MSVCSAEFRFVGPNGVSEADYAIRAHASQAATTAIVPVDPLVYPGWDGLLANEEDSSFFHGTSWARVLHETYGHRPFYLANINGSTIESLLPVMEVSSWCTTRRGVSLPFTDKCPPARGGASLYESALAIGRQRGWRYVQCRDISPAWRDAQPSVSFYTHTIGLQGDMEGPFKRMASSLRRGIRKAQDEGLKVTFESEADALSLYYSLHCRTRRKHGVPPQPFRFFANIGRYVVRTGQGFVAVCRWQGRPIAAAVFLHNRRKAIYKFGASDERFQQLRPNNLLMWEAMKHCASRGCESLDLGRTSMANEGLRRFKVSLGAEEQTLSYVKYDLKLNTFVTEQDRAEGRLNQIFRNLPAPLFRLAGRVLYPHLS
jgi:hypothetical protein